MNSSNNQLFVYVGAVAVTGAAAVAHAMYGWQSASNPVATVSYVVLALMASAVKLRIPGLTGSVSPGFVSVLTGVALMPLAETVLVVTAMAAVQTLWKAGKRPKLVQAGFNVANLAASTWVAYGVAHAAAPDSAVLRVAAAIAPLYLLNAGVVAGVLSLSSEGTLRSIWKRFQFTLFPYYVVGGLLAALISLAGQAPVAIVLLFPLVGLVYLSFTSYKSLVERLERLSASKCVW